MYFIDKRIQVICDQLKALRVRDSRELPDWQYKRGLFFRPEEAERSDRPGSPLTVSTCTGTPSMTAATTLKESLKDTREILRASGGSIMVPGNVTIPAEMAGSLSG